MTAPQGDPTAPGAPAGTSPGIQQPTAPTAGGAPPSAPPGAPPPASPWDGFQWDGKVESLPEPVAKLIQDTRREAGAARTNAKAQAAQDARDELAAQFAEWLGLGGGEEPPSADELAQHLQATRAEANSQAAQLRIMRLGAEHGLSVGDVDDFLDSNRVVEQIEKISGEVAQGDVAAWDAKVGEVIAKWAAGRPQPQTAATSRTPVAALRPGALPGTAQVSLADQIAEAEKAGNVRESIALKQQIAAANRK